VTDDQVILDGQRVGPRGGHGPVRRDGQGRAGDDLRDILATYYNGLRPRPRTTGLPDRIRVGLADQLDDLTMHADGPFQVRVGGQTITDRGMGTWTIQTAADRTMRLVAPPGYGAPLVVDPTSTPDSTPSPSKPSPWRPW
jgi:hypothetical protein